MSNGPRVVAVTGAAGYIGQRLLARLQEEPHVESVLATDVRPHSQLLPKVTFLEQDILEPLEEAFHQHGVQGLVHLAFVLRQGRDPEVVRRVNVGGAQNVLRACRSAGVQRILYVSSSTVYGPHQDNPARLTEEHPVRPPAVFQYAVHKAESEALFQAYARDVPGACVSLLRGCVVMGPSAHNFITQALFKPILIGVRGYDPPMQFLHEDDMVELLVHFLTHESPGVYNVAGPGEVRYSALVRMARRPLVWLPAPIAYGLTNLTWALHLQNDSPGVGLDFIRYPWVVSTEKLCRETGYEFKHTCEEALQAFLVRDRTAREVA